MSKPGASDLAYSHSQSIASDDDEYNYSSEEEDDELEDAAMPNSAALRRQESSASSIPEDHATTFSPTAGASKKKRICPGLGGKRAAGGVRNARTDDEYRVIDEEELFMEQRKLVREIAQVLEISSSIAAVLLRFFGWNKEKLIDQYFADPESARQSAGVEFANAPALVLPEDKELECTICCDTFAPKHAFSMGCGHVFCDNCWKSYLTVKISEGPPCVCTTCPAHGCKEVVTDKIFDRFVSREDMTKYSRYVLRSYVDINKCVKWCPSPGCNKAISSAGGLSTVRCTCGCMFCLRCGEEAHSPVSCEQLQAWKDKCQNESETANWILANTKRCPKCSVRIEKNQGCNHMTCRKCQFEFCWICMGDWTKHGANTGGYYKCNRYDGKEVSDSDVARAKAELDRYLHYYQRYQNHAEAGRFAERFRKGTEERMIKLQATHGDSSWIDVQFLNAAVEQLIECRRVLRYTYVLAYYLPAGKEKELFEYLQEDLEKNTEHLTGLTELDLERMDRAEIVNYTRVTETFLRNLLTGVEDGLTTPMPSTM